ncbi:MAG: FmdE family protein [Bacillota bacterium]
MGIASWDEVVKFHGHSCMGLAMGYRVSEAALKELGSSRDVDEELIAIVENDSCAVDAVQYVTGCTMGKGNLFFKDHGKPVYTFYRRSDGKAVRLVAKGPDEKRYPELTALREKLLSGEATDEDREKYDQKAEEALKAFLADPLESAVDIRELEIDPPEKARIFNTVTCAECGERVMEPRARVKKGQIVCIPCADPYDQQA